MLQIQQQYYGVHFNENFHAVGSRHNLLPLQLLLPFSGALLFNFRCGCNYSRAHYNNPCTFVGDYAAFMTHITITGNSNNCVICVLRGKLLLSFLSAAGSNTVCRHNIPPLPCRVGASSSSLADIYFCQLAHFFSISHSRCAKNKMCPSYCVTGKHDAKHKWN